MPGKPGPEWTGASFAPAAAPCYIDPRSGLFPGKDGTEEERIYGGNPNHRTE